MAQVQSDLAVSYANQVMSLIQQLRGMRQVIAELVTVNANNPLGNLWNVLRTTALAADGQLGTADGTVVAANPIDPRVYPAISRTASQTALNNALQILVDFNSFCAGSSLGANASRPAQIDAVAM